jgi:hypothetical protein
VQLLNARSAHLPDHPRLRGKKIVVQARYVRNRRLADALHQQAMCALTTSPGARAFYDRRRAAPTVTTKPSAPSRTGWSGSTTDASPTISPTRNHGLANG